MKHRWSAYIDEHWATIGDGRMRHLDIAVGGMTCASCAMRIERKLNRLPGVVASVNYATGTASVDFDPDTVRAERLIEQVEGNLY